MKRLTVVLFRSFLELPILEAISLCRQADSRPPIFGTSIRALTCIFEECQTDTAYSSPELDLG